MKEALFPYTPTTHLPPGNVLVLAPHPDDEVFGCAGAIMQHLIQGDQVTVIIATDGGTAVACDNSTEQLNYIALRKQESEQAAVILGNYTLLFWDIADRGLTVNDALLQTLLQEITQRHIINLYAPSLAEIHPDHHALAELAVSATIQHLPDMNLIMYEVGVPLHPNILLDITPVLARKQQAMQCFTSQLQLQDYTRHLSSLNIYRSYSLPAHVQAAEAYYLLHNKILRARPYLKFGHTAPTILLETMSHQLGNAAAQLDTLQQILTATYHSRSWRITAPLRWLSQWLRYFKS